MYPSSDRDLLFEAFRVLDQDKKGYIDLNTLYNLLKNMGYYLQFIITKNFLF